eukprot:3678951-Prymnesium_polylepis.1
MAAGPYVVKQLAFLPSELGVKTQWPGEADPLVPADTPSSPGLLEAMHARRELTLTDTTPPIAFRVSGASILADGQPFYIKGVNWFGMEDTHGSLGGLGYRPLNDILDFLTTNSFNAVRLPVSVVNVLNGDTFMPLYVHETFNQDLASLSYLEMLDEIVDRCANRGVLIMLDMHRLDVARDPVNSKLWYSENTPESSLIAAWSLLATRYCGRWGVFAADLFNEPYAASWGQGGEAFDWDLAAQRLGDVVLSICPRWLVFVGGVGHNSIRCDGLCSSATTMNDVVVSSCLGGAWPPGSLFSCLSAPTQTDAINHWWGGNMEGVRPPGRQVQLSGNLTNGSRDAQLVYSPHIYGPSVYAMSYFTLAQGYPDNLPAIWDEHFGFVPAMTDKPVVVSEWGGHYTDTGPTLPVNISDKVWQQKFLQYLTSNSIGFFYVLPLRVELALPADQAMPCLSYLPQLSVAVVFES